MGNSDAVNSIITMRREGMRFGTSRTRSLLDRLGAPDDKLKIIHVAGTNGKGSVCEYITRILMRAGKKVGTYTTPEVFCFDDQFRIDGSFSAALTEKYLSAARSAAELEKDGPTAYEIQTAAAFLMFASENCEYAVIECCMGGLEDTTNAVHSKVAAAITSISLEHTAYLGDNILSICRHKAGIIRNCPAVVSACVKGEARGYFAALGARFAGDDVKILSSDVRGTRFLCGGEEYFTQMPGCMQPYNAAVAIDIARLLGMDNEAVRRGIADASASGRLQIIRRWQRDYILDGAHNPESAEPLARLLKGEYSGKNRTLIYGCLSDKDVKAVLSRLSGCAERVYAVPPPSERAMDYEKIFFECRSVFPHVFRADSVGGALDLAEGDVVAVCGTFTILKEAFEWTEKRR